MNDAWLYTGIIGHARLGKVRNRFTYPGFFLCFPIARKDQLRRWLFSVNRWNLFSYFDADHGDGGPAETWVRHILAEHGLDRADGDIWLQTMPRILGHVFNPVSFWYCHDREGALRAVLCEVNNTFGERHGYLLSAPDQAVIQDDSELRSTKVFHVSPFCPVAGEYRFRFQHHGSKRRVSIDYWQDDELTLTTYVSGQAKALNDRQLVKTFLSLGWATVMVVARIHWQALKLWRKGVRFHTKPLPPVLEITQ